MTEPREVELKLQVAAADVERIKRKLDRDPHLADGARTELLESQYFDTRDHRLHRAGATLRVRRRGARNVQTVKCDAPEAGEMFDRGEWETEIDGEKPDLRAARDTALKSLVSRKLSRALRPAFKTSVERTAYRIGAQDWMLELAIDRGQIAGPGRRAPISELELELRRGEPRHLFALAGRLRKVAPLRLAMKSKAARGYDLIEGRPIGPAKGAPLRLPRRLPAGQAFRHIARSCVYQLAANEPALQQGDAEAVHQMRVAIRRLRAAISLFSEMVGDGRVAQIKSGLKWMAAQLAAARELDVFLKRLRSPPHVPRGAQGPLESLRVDVTRRRHHAIQHAKMVARSRRFDDLLFETLSWIEAGPWTTHHGVQGALREEPLADRAAQQLSRRCRKIAKRGKALQRLDAKRRHKLRIQIKKVRYATDFFSGAFTGTKARKRKKELTTALKRMQTALGELNDVMAHEEIAARIAHARSHSANGRSPQRAYAAGLVIGEEEAQIERLLRDGAAAHSRFRDAAPFWV